MQITSGYASPREREYLFIDGGCLRETVRTICKDLFGVPDAYLPNISVLGLNYDKVFYYDAVPGRQHKETQPAYETRVQSDYDRLAKIQALDRVHVPPPGKIVGKEKRQKGVDVRLAVDMMTHAFRGTISRATIFAGDADFVPLIQALVAAGLHVTLWHPPQANDELKGASDTARLFSFRHNHPCFSLDGQQRSAFYASAGGSSGLETLPQGPVTVTLGGREFLGRWQEGILTIWRSDPSNGTWSWQTMTAPDADLSRALKAFDAIHSWGVAPSGEQWVTRS